MVANFIQKTTWAVGASVRVRSDDGSAVNMRDGAGTAAAVLGQVTSGTSGTVTGGPTTTNGMVWYQVETTLAIAWIAGMFVIRS